MQVLSEQSDLENSQPLSRAELLAEQFYSWEHRGRGWFIWDEPVRPEPPFEHFEQRPVNGPAADDGRRQTLFSGLVDWLSGRLSGRRELLRAAASSPVEPEPEVLQGPPAIVELEVRVPSSLKVSKDIAEQFLFSISNCRYPLTFEMIGTTALTSIQIAASLEDADHVHAQLAAHFPEASVIRHKGLLEEQWNESAHAHVAIVEMGLSREFMLPLANQKSFSIDPLVGIAGALADVEADEAAILQIMFEPVRNPWAASILRSVVTSSGDAFFSGPLDILGQSKLKVARPLYGAVIRIACRSRSERRTWDLARNLVGSLIPLSNPLGNELIPLENDDYPMELHVEDLTLRRSRRSGMILNSDELVALVHVPSEAVRSPKLMRSGSRTKAAPTLVLNHPLVLGQNQHANRAQAVTLSDDQRTRHTHVVGASGTGKSTLLLNLIMQDIHRGQGVAVLDPHGDLIDRVLERIPQERIADVVLFDPADEEFPIGFNILSAHSEIEKTLLASDLVSVFRRLSTSWGDQMNAVLSNAILAIVESDRGGTLADMRRFLIERPYREEYLKSVRDPHVVYYWQKEFPLLVGKPHAPVLTRLDGFLRPSAVRRVVCQKENRLNLADIMDRGRIFLAKLSHGAIGQENAHMLGALLVSKFHQLALGRQQLEVSKRRYFWLYIDEFQHFATQSMAELLSGVRKYRMGLVLAHQELHQLESRSPDLASAVLGNAYTRVCFRVSERDARRLEDGLSSFTAKDLQNLGTGEAICRVERSDYDFNLSVPPAEEVDEATATNLRNEITMRSRQSYGTARNVVDDELRQGLSPIHTEPLLSNQKTQPQTTTEAPLLPTETTSDIDIKPMPSRPRKNVIPTEEMPLGRGGPKHRYIQQLIKQYAEGLGYRATIEGNVLGGKGIDVALQKGKTTIACEICITTGDTHELANVRKCLAAGFKHVAVVAPDTPRLNKLRAAIERELLETERSQVQFCLPDELLAFIRETEVRQLDTEVTVRGYKVKTSFTGLDPAESSDRRQMVSRVVAKAMHRLKERNGKRN
jgi:hypothetical protein